MRKKVILLLTIVMTFGVAIQLTACNSYNNDIQMNLFSPEFVANHDASLAILAEIQRSFPRTLSDNIIYPEFFGGAYIDVYGNLVILVTSNDYLDMFNDARSSVTVRQVEFSYATLNSNLDIISEFLSENWALDCITLSDCIIAKNIRAAYVDTINNRIVVYVSDVFQIDLFTEVVINHPSIEFVVTSDNL